MNCNNNTNQTTIYSIVSKSVVLSLIQSLQDNTKRVAVVKIDHNAKDGLFYCTLCNCRQVPYNFLKMFTTISKRVELCY